MLWGPAPMSSAEVFEQMNAPEWCSEVIRAINAIRGD